jgi:transcriptional regulator with XRE-family HTH domain
MTRKVRTYQAAAGDTPTAASLLPKHLSKREFGRRLYNLMLARGWHQSELARRAGLSRDRISTYVRGAAMPTPANVEALARALDVEAEAILPNYIMSVIDEDAPALEIRSSPAAPGKAWLRVNRLVTLATAVRIADLLEHDNLADGKGGRAPAAVQPIASEEAAAGGAADVPAKPVGAGGRG